MEAYNIKKNRNHNPKQTNKISPFKTGDDQNPHHENLQSGNADMDMRTGKNGVEEMLGSTGEAALIRKIKKKDLHQWLKCPLCEGFFRDAHTINECLDTFCKSCIYKYFYEDSNREMCPKCGTHLGGKPADTIISDQTIQKIVDLLYP